jgi:hypothetical protein
MQMKIELLHKRLSCSEQSNLLNYYAILTETVLLTIS